MANPNPVRLPPLDHFTGDARVYERRSPSGKGRQVVKESVSLSERKTPQIFPDQSRISIRNEAGAIRYVRKHTTIPAPSIVEFSDQPGAPVQLVTKFVRDGVPPKALRITPEGRARIVQQLEGYISQLQALTNPECRSFAGPPLFAVRFENAHLPLSDCKYRRYDTDSPYVLCHGDLAWHNLLLDPETFEIKCVVDREYAGFYPKEVESEYWRRPGPLAAMSSRDKDDKDDVLGVLWKHRVQDTSVKPASNDDAGSNSPLRQVLTAVHLPLSTTPSYGAILSRGVDSGRRQVASGMTDLAGTLMAEHDGLARLVTELSPNTRSQPVSRAYTMEQDHEACLDLSRALSDAFAQFAKRFEGSAAGFLPLSDYLSAEVDVLAQLEAREKLEAPAGSEGEREEAALRSKAREMRAERRNMAEQAYHDADVNKWSAIDEFATTLLTLSAAAKSVQPYLADHDHEHTSSREDPERAWAEFRAREVSRKMMTGGWVVRVDEDPEVVAELTERFQTEWAESEGQRAIWVQATRQYKLEGVRWIEKEDRVRAEKREKLRVGGDAGPVPEE